MLQVCQSILFLESSGSTFAALVSSAKFDFKLPEVKEGLYSINTRSSHTFPQLLHSLLSKITILSSAGKLRFSFAGRDGQRMSSSRRRAFCSASPLPPAFFQRRRDPRVPAAYEPPYTLAPRRIRPRHPAARGQPPPCRCGAAQTQLSGSAHPPPDSQAPGCDPGMSQSRTDSFLTQIPAPKEPGRGETTVRPWIRRVNIRYIKIKGRFANV